MKIIIELDTTDTDDRVEALLTVLGRGARLAPVNATFVDKETETAPTGEEATEPRKPAAKRASKKAAAKPKPEPTEEADEAEDLIGGDSQPTLQDAVALAGKLVASGKASDVKAILKELGFGRVSEMDGDDEAIAAFVRALG